MEAGCSADRLGPSREDEDVGPYRMRIPEALKILEATAELEASSCHKRKIKLSQNTGVGSLFKGKSGSCLIMVLILQQFSNI